MPVVYNPLGDSAFRKPSGQEPRRGIWFGDSFKLFYNGKKAQNGVGIVVSQALRDNVVEVTRISDRLMSLIIDTGAITLRVVSCYASQTNCSNAEKEEFWASLEPTYKPSN